MEGGPRWRERSREETELMASPEKAFDSDLESARREALRVTECLRRVGEIKRNGSGATLETKEVMNNGVPMIQITWPARPGGEAMMLKLVPIVEGKGAEAGVAGYAGSYGAYQKENGELTFDGQEISLKKLFGVPEDLNLVIVPTIQRWAVEREGLYSLIHGEKTCAMYVGLGFLLKAEEFLLVGMHEGGHLPHNHDENKAWTAANQRYAEIHKPKKEVVLAGKETGLFNLLKRPSRFGNTPTIGKIVSYGLVSHNKADGKTVIPESWQNKSQEIMRELKDLIVSAGEEFENIFGN